MAPLDFSQRRRPESCLSDLALDRLAVGESVTDGSAAAHLGHCARCSGRLAELRRFNAEAALQLARGPLALRRQLRLRTWTRAASGLALAAVLLLALIPLWRHAPVPGGPATTTTTLAANDTRGKGLALPLQLSVVARHAGDGHVEELLPTSAVRPGDAVRFLLSISHPGQVVVLGLDAAGKVSVYVADGERGLTVERGERQPMPGSIVLDDTPGAERLVALLCHAPIAVPEVVRRAQRQLDAAEHEPHRAGALDLPGCVETAWLLEKTTAP